MKKAKTATENYIDYDSSSASNEIPLFPESLSDLQQKHLKALLDRYIKRTKTSKQMAQTYRSVLADPREGEWFNLPTKEMCYHISGKQAQGSRIWDIDGNEYIDLIMGSGANLLGHNPPFIQEALQEQLQRGIHQIGHQSELAGEVAELVCQLTGMERVAFSNTGAEAVLTAIQIAQMATKRSKIAIFSGSYHGPYLVPTSATESNNSQDMSDRVLMLDYGNPQSLEIIKAHQNELAAVLVKPIQEIRPDLQPKEFLQQLRKLTAKSGISLIFDEMVTGFRLHLGGAQAWFGVEADLAIYGKVAGGGMPIGIVAGKADYMDKVDGGRWNYGDSSSPSSVDKTLFIETYCKHPLSMPAARAILQYLKSQGPTLQQQLNQRTLQYVERLNFHFEASNMPLRIGSFGSFFSFVFTEEAVPSDMLSMSVGLLRYHLFNRGIMLSGADFLSTAHTDEDIDYIVEAMEDSINELQSAGFFPILKPENMRV